MCWKRIPIVMLPRNILQSGSPWMSQNGMSHTSVACGTFDVCNAHGVMLHKASIAYSIEYIMILLGWCLIILIMLQIDLQYFNLENEDGGYESNYFPEGSPKLTSSAHVHLVNCCKWMRMVVCDYETITMSHNSRLNEWFE